MAAAAAAAAASTSFQISNEFHCKQNQLHKQQQ